MNKELKRCLLAAAVIFAAALICLFTGDKTLALSFEMPPDATGGFITVADGDVICIESQQCSDGALTAVFKAVSEGETLSHVNFEPVDNDELSIYELDLELSGTFFGGVYESISGTFSGWHIVVWAAGVFLLACSAILFNGYFSRRGEYKFSYITVIYAGLGLFTLIQGIFAVFFAIRCINDAGMTMWVLYMQIFTACQSFLIYTSPIVAVFCLALIVSNLVLLKREGFALSNLFASAVAVFILCAAAFGIWMFYSPINFSLRNIVCNVYAALFCYFECMMFAVVICTLSVSRNIPDLKTEYLLILGCKIRSDGTLYPLIRSRVDRALEFAQMQEKAGLPRCIFVPTGGKGSDECISEGEAMARYLRQHKVSDDRILIEKQSVNTWENMCMSRALIERQHRGDIRCAFVTSSFHVFRSGMLASQAGWAIDGMGSKTVWYFWPNAFIRELLGLIGSRIGLHLSVMAVIAAFFTAISFIV